MLQDESKLLAKTANRAAGDFVLVSRAHLLGQLIVVVVYLSLSLSLFSVPLYWAVSFSLSLAVFLISCAALLSTYCSICCTAKFLLRRFSSYFGHRQQPYNLRQVICLTGPEREGKTEKQLPDETGKTLPTSWQWP